MKKFFILIAIAFIVLSGVVYFRARTISRNEAELPVTPPSSLSQPLLRVVLIPLDSRPPCTQYLEELGNIAGIKVIVPPMQILDNYRTPADKPALRKWLYDEVKNADAAIVSVDMLTHGSLLASRLSAGTPEESQEALELLKSIHQESPNVKLYAFNIIPRLILGDSRENTMYQNNMLQYSVLKDQVLTFENPLDNIKLQQLEQKTPAEVINRYNAMYQHNASVNTALAQMVKDGILSGVVIGQDDSQSFGIPNINKQQIQHYIESHPELSGKLAVTRGTDEVALTMLGKIASDFTGYHSHIFVVYSDDDASRKIMPYMPNTVATTVQEKINLIGGIQVPTIDECDFILYVHVGTKNNEKRLSLAWAKLENLLRQGRKIALVDLSENFEASQTLLPFFLKHNITPAQLIAYAGWNTTSNSVGTAVTQAVLFTQSTAHTRSTDSLIEAYEYNLEFLVARFLDDWYYQKEVQPFVNKRLKSYKFDPYNLGTHYQQTDDLVRKMMLSKSRRFFNDYLRNRPIIIQTDHPIALRMAELKLETQLPWPRTFEIWLKPSLYFTKNL